MTTIAWDGKTLAADSRVTEDGAVWQSPDQKIFKIREDSIALCGDCAECMAFLDWYKDQSQDYPSDIKDMTALVFQVKTRKMVLYEGYKAPYPAPTPYAMGSGSRAAMGAMLAGASARRAVEIACRLDAYTGPPVVSRGLIKRRRVAK